MTTLEPLPVPDMDLLDYFAAAALPAVITSVCNTQHTAPEDIRQDDWIAISAYRIAAACCLQSAKRKH